MQRLVAGLAALIMAVTCGVAAVAHAFLNHAAPPVDSTLPISPKEIRLTFSEGVEPRFSGIELATADGRTIATAPAISAPGDDRQLVLAVPSLAPGRYKVSWHVVSVDTHRTEGTYGFAVAP